MANSLEILEWDSSFFGYPVARITAHEITEDKLTALVAEAKKSSTRLVYLFTDPADTVSTHSAKSIHAKLVDQKITYHIYIKNVDAATVDAHIEEFEGEHPTAKLVDLSLQSGLYSRYKIDTEFKNKEFERMYLAWIENSVNKKIADHIFVYMEDGKELGFVTLKARSNNAQIGLIAVDESSRGKAIGKKLVAAVIIKLQNKNIPELDVATQIDNADACNFYEKVGFKGIKTENIYHIWL